MVDATRKQSRWRLLLPWVFAAAFADAIRWAVAHDLSGQQRYEEALRKVRSVRGDLRDHMEWYVFEIQQLSLLRWNLETIEKANAFLVRFGIATPKTENEKYLLTYVRWCGQDAFVDYSQDGPIPLGFVFDASIIDLSKVSAHHKRNYPLTIHPSWSSSSPFYPNNRIARRPKREDWLQKE